MTEFIMRTVVFPDPVSLTITIMAWFFAVNYDTGQELERQN